jgi:hypothetical protein
MGFQTSDLLLQLFLSGGIFRQRLGLKRGIQFFPDGIEFPLHAAGIGGDGDHCRESLRRWREQEETGRGAPIWLEQEIQEGLDSPDLPGGTGFWRDLRKELHGEHKNGSCRR